MSKLSSTNLFPKLKGGREAGSQTYHEVPTKAKLHSLCHSPSNTFVGLEYVLCKCFSLPFPSDFLCYSYEISVIEFSYLNMLHSKLHLCWRCVAPQVQSAKFKL
jgi:hypothetical protein